ncbi:MAG: ferrous iron transporter B, partial [Phycisphaerales bacterium]|nr:ferrous iron transporter B [Phycisphaerales bacterium]
GSRERLATILVAPFMSCTARIPVYVLLTILLFPGSPTKQTLAFAGCYLLGIGAGLFSAMVARRTLLRGAARPMAIELPPYRLPSLRTAVLTTWDRGLVFLRKAGTVIFAISVVLWWMSTYPVAEPPAEAVALAERAAALEAQAPEEATALHAEAEHITAAARARGSALGRMGAVMEPVFRPLGYDRQLTVGVLASFAAREVFVATMAVQVLGVEADDVEDQGMLDELAVAQRSDGSGPIFTTATSWSLLVYYVLAMQCLPTLAVTAREAGHWKWAALQFAWMSGMAWVAATIVYQALMLAGVH